MGARDNNAWMMMILKILIQKRNYFISVFYILSTQFRDIQQLLYSEIDAFHAAASLLFNGCYTMNKTVFYYFRLLFMRQSMLQYCSRRQKML